MMVWRDQAPPATDVLLDVNVPFSGGGLPAIWNWTSCRMADTGQPVGRCLSMNSEENRT
jgi:hypothetical protein